MNLRGASEEEVIKSIRSGNWTAARLGKFQTKYRHDFNELASVNQKFYKYKIIEPIFSDEPEEIVVITVKVYYSNEG